MKIINKLMRFLIVANRKSPPIKTHEPEMDRVASCTSKKLIGNPELRLLLIEIGPPPLISGNTAS
ncbi:MAG: hypothetical protein K2X93_15755 [Candidatus Obscuribacterales bacterium]|nr:hypothetical protein [Candidatus Obscuribacterales bacterium]